jgi:DNA-binding beta-propeller fold protein YncE
MRFEDLTAVTVKGPVLLNVTPCGMFTDVSEELDSTSPGYVMIHDGATGSLGTSVLI